MASKPYYNFSMSLIRKEKMRRNSHVRCEYNRPLSTSQSFSSYTPLNQTKHDHQKVKYFDKQICPFHSNSMHIASNHPVNTSRDYTHHLISNSRVMIQPNQHPLIQLYRLSQPNFINKRYNSNSFIKSVLDQVKKDIEKQPELKKAMQEMRESANKRRSNTDRMKAHFTKNMGSVQGKMTEVYKNFQTLYMAISTSLNSLYDHYDWLGKSMKYVKLTISHVVIGMKFLSDKATAISNSWKEDPIAEKRAAEWRKAQAIRRYKKEQELAKAKTETEEETPKEKEEIDEQSVPLETSLILSKSSAWDRFGTRLKDMPFLQSFYENPLLGKIFGETEIAASIREMKIVDSSFNFPEFMDMVQEIVAPHLVQCFLEGDRDSLRLHCGDAAFNAAVMSIKERDMMKVVLDPTILRFNPIDLVGAKRIDDDTPWFIFSFTAQQINCLRDIKGNVVSGAVDDIRDVLYSIALTKHPEPEVAGLHHPWMIKEFAILGSTPSW